MPSLRRELAISWLVLRKDLRLEARRMYELLAMLAFSILALSALSVTLGPSPPHVSAVVPALIWIIVLFAGMFSFTVIFIREADAGTLDGLRLLPASPQAILLGKSAFCFLLMLLTQVFIVPLSMAFFDYVFKSNVLLVLAVFALGTLGLSMVGALVSALAMYSESKAIMIPLITMPLAIAILIPATTATGKLIVGAGLGLLLPEIRLMATFIVIMVAIAWLTFSLVFYE